MHHTIITSSLTWERSLARRAVRKMSCKCLAAGEWSLALLIRTFPTANKMPASFCGDPFIPHAFQWRDGVLTDLGALPGLNFSNANRISNSGLVAGFSETEAIDPLLGVKECTLPLERRSHHGSLGTQEGGYESVAFAVNSRGEVARGSFNTTADVFGFLGTQQRVFLWQNGIMEDVGTLAGPDAGLLGGPG
jgi:probable HAF family extracellular repeat protein